MAGKKKNEHQRIKTKEQHKKDAEKNKKKQQSESSNTNNQTKPDNSVTPPPGFPTIVVPSFLKIFLPIIYVIFWIMFIINYILYFLGEFFVFIWTIVVMVANFNYAQQACCLVCMFIAFLVVWNELDFMVKRYEESFDFSNEFFTKYLNWENLKYDLNPIDIFARWVSYIVIFGYMRYFTIYAPIYVIIVFLFCLFLLVLYYNSLFAILVYLCIYVSSVTFYYLGKHNLPTVAYFIVSFFLGGTFGGVFYLYFMYLRPLVNGISNVIKKARSEMSKLKKKGASTNKSDSSFGSFGSFGSGIGIGSGSGSNRLNSMVSSFNSQPQNPFQQMPQVIPRTSYLSGIPIGQGTIVPVVQGTIVNNNPIKK
jgi:hypothetical protein